MVSLNNIFKDSLGLLILDFFQGLVEFLDTFLCGLSHDHIEKTGWKISFEVEVGELSELTIFTNLFDTSGLENLHADTACFDWDVIPFDCFGNVDELFFINLMKGHLNQIFSI